MHKTTSTNNDKEVYELVQINKKINFNKKLQISTSIKVVQLPFPTCIRKKRKKKNNIERERGKKSNVTCKCFTTCCRKEKAQSTLNLKNI